MKAEVELPDLVGGTYSDEWRIPTHGEVYLSVGGVPNICIGTSVGGSHHIINGSPELRASAIAETRRAWMQHPPSPECESRYYKIMEQLKELEAAGGGK